MSVDLATLSADQLIGMYVKLRDRIKAKEDEYKESLKPAKSTLEEINARLLALLNEAGGDSIKTAHGTAYRTEKTSASLTDPQNFRDFVIANELFDMVDWRANSTAVQEYNSEYGELPPGVKYNSAFVVGVRRAGAE